MPSRVPQTAHHLVGEGLRALPFPETSTPISTPPPCVGAGLILSAYRLRMQATPTCVPQTAHHLVGAGLCAGPFPETSTISQRPARSPWQVTQLS